MLAGVVAAALASRNSLTVALILSACIFAYDGLLKSTPLGPVAMGGCRFLNVILGASSAGFRWTEPWLLPQSWVAGALGVYIVGVTWFARQEAGTSRRPSLLAAAIVINLGLAGLMLLTHGRIGVRLNWSGAASPASVLLVLGMIALIINRRIARAVGDPVPRHVQAAVKVMLLSIITLDATLIYFKLGEDGAPWAVATAALLLPSLLIGRWLYMT
jgi:4-hydroxybenzoate polyprenyltransferase